MPMQVQIQAFCGHTGELHAILTEGTGVWTSTLPTHVTISDPSDPESEVHCDILTSGHPTYPYVDFYLDSYSRRRNR